MCARDFPRIFVWNDFELGSMYMCMYIQLCIYTYVHTYNIDMHVAAANSMIEARTSAPPSAQNFYVKKISRVHT